MSPHRRQAASRTERERRPQTAGSRERFPPGAELLPQAEFCYRPTLRRSRFSSHATHHVLRALATRFGVRPRFLGSSRHVRMSTLRINVRPHRPPKTRRPGSGDATGSPVRRFHKSRATRPKLPFPHATGHGPRSSTRVASSPCGRRPFHARKHGVRPSFLGSSTEGRMSTLRINV